MRNESNRNGKEFLSKKKNFIFDLDGTLIDSMWVWDNLLVDFLNRHNYETPPELLREVAYMSLEQSSKRVCELFELPMSPKDVNREWTEMIYDGYAKEIKTKPGAAEYLENLKREGKTVALATANSKELTEACLKNNGIMEYFDVLTFADEVGEGKSSPLIYTETLSRVNGVPDESVLFEDILQAYKTAKMIPLDVVIVEDRSAEGDKSDLMKSADLYIKDFYDLI